MINSKLWVFRWSQEPPVEQKSTHTPIVGAIHHCCTDNPTTCVSALRQAAILPAIERAGTGCAMKELSSLMMAYAPLFFDSESKGQQSRDAEAFMSVHKARQNVTSH